MSPPVNPVAPKRTRSRSRSGRLSARRSLIAPSCHAEPRPRGARPTAMPTAQRVRNLVTGATVVTSLAAAVGVGYALGNDPDGGGRPPASPPIVLANADLTVAAGCDELLDSYVDRALEEVGPYGWGGGVVYDVMTSADAGAAAAPSSEAARSTVSTSRSTSNESGTNVQEAGVDEADVVKVSGSLLLRLRDGRAAGVRRLGRRAAPAVLHPPRGRPRQQRVGRRSRRGDGPRRRARGGPRHLDGRDVDDDHHGRPRRPHLARASSTRPRSAAARRRCACTTTSCVSCCRTVCPSSTSPPPTGPSASSGRG